MKSKRRLVCAFLIALVSLTLFGCYATGEKMVGLNINSRNGQNFEVVDYVYNKTGHIAKVHTKRKGSTSTHVNTLYYNVLADDNVILIDTYPVPENFLDMLYLQYPESFLEDVRTYQQLEELLPKVSFAVNTLNAKITTAKSPADWNAMLGYAVLANTVMEIYKEAYEKAPDHITDEFPKPPVQSEPYEWSDPSEYIDYSFNDLAEWGYAMRVRNSKQAPIK